MAAEICNAQLRNSIEPKIEKILRKNQIGSQRNRSTTSQILTIRRILDGVSAKNLPVTMLFVDLWLHTLENDWTHTTRIQPTPKNCRRHNDAILKHKSKSPFPTWRHWLIRFCSRCTTSRHISPMSLYHLSRLSREHLLIKWKKTVSGWQRKEVKGTQHKQLWTRTTPIK